MYIEGKVQSGGEACILLVIVYSIVCMSVCVWIVKVSFDTVLDG